jgi:hypothetical protein
MSQMQMQIQIWYFDCTSLWGNTQVGMNDGEFGQAPPLVNWNKRIEHIELQCFAVGMTGT